MKHTRILEGSLRLNHNVCKSDPGVRGTDSHSTFFLIIPLCFYWYQKQDAPTFHQLVGMPYFLSKFLKISPGAEPGAAAVVWAGGSGALAPANRARRTRTAPAPGGPSVAGSRVPGAARAAASSHGRDSGTFPLPSTLGLEGFAFHMAPGGGGGHKVVDAAAAAAAGQASRPLSEPDLPVGWTL